MLRHIPIAAGDFEGFFWLLIIVATIVAQIVKASRKAAKTAKQPADEDAKSYTAPPDELRRFLEEIAGKSAPEPAAPKPRAVKAAEAPRKREASRSMDRDMTRPYVAKSGGGRQRTTAPPITPLTRAEARRLARPAAGLSLMGSGTAEIDAYLEAGQPGDGASALRKAVVDDLRSIESLRKAFVLSEVVGQPISARRPRQV